MRVRDARFIAAFVVLCAITVLSTGSTRAASADARVVAADTSRHPLVELTVDVPGGGAVRDWQVSVVEGGDRQPATITGGERAINEVVLVVDSSGSMAGDAMDAAKAAARGFVSQLPPGTAVSIVGFGDRPYLVSPLTGDVAALRAAIDVIAAAGETALYDALDLAVGQFSTSDAPRSVILVSDGGDTVSTMSLPSVTSRLVDGKVRLFGVRLATDESNAAVLDGLAAATGGQSVDANADVAALTATYESIAASALSQLRISYRSEAFGSTAVRVELAGGGSDRLAETTIDFPAAPPTTVRPQLSAPSARRDVGRDDGWAVVLGGGAMFLALTLLIQRALVRRPKSLLAVDRPGRDRSRGLRDVKDALGARLERTLEAKGRRQALSQRLERAGMAVRPGEYVVMVGAAAAFTGLSGALMGGAPLALVFGALSVVGALFLLRSRGTRRRVAVADQLPDMLQQLTSSLRAGYGVMQSLDAVAREIGGPIGEEMRRVVAEVQLGRDLAESLQALADRVGGTDFDWVVQAIEINREVGGDLVEVIEAVADTIRAREQLQRQLKTLSAEGRLSARILLAMPFVMAGAISLLSPGYLTPLGSGAGPFVIAAGCVLMAMGWLWLRKIVQIEY